MTKTWLLGMLLAAAVLAGGCLEPVDVNRRVLVSAIAIDLPADGSEGFEVTIEYLRPQGGGGGGLFGGGGGEFRPVTRRAQAATVRGALNIIRDEVEGPIYMGSVQLVMIGEELARGDMVPALDYLFREPRFPMAAVGVIAQGRASRYLEVATSGKENGEETLPVIQHLIEALAAGGGRDDMTIGDIRLYRIFDHIFHPRGAVWTHFIIMGERAPAFDGAAVLSGGRLAAILPHEQKGLLTSIDRGAVFYHELPAPDGHGRLGLMFRRLRTSVGPWHDPEAPVPVRMQGAAFIHEAGPLEPGMLATRHDAQALQQHVERELARQMQDLLQEMYGQGIDLLGLEREALRRGFRSVDGQGVERWLREANFDVQPRVQLLHGQRGR